LLQHDTCEHRAAFGIVDVGPVHQDLMEISHAIDDDLTLTSLYFFSPRQSRAVPLYSPFSHFERR
jgi:hypothetical protein